MALNKQEQKLIDQVLRNAPITNRARDVLRKLYLIAESDVYTVHMTNESQTLPAAVDGAVSSYIGSGTTISVYRGSNQLTGITSGTPIVGQFKVTATGTQVTVGAQSITDTYNITFAKSSGIDDDDDTAKISFSINAENVNTFVKVLDFTKAKIGATGAAGATGDTGAVGKTVSLSAGAQIISYNAAGDNGTGTITLTANSQNFTNAFFRFVGGGGAFTNETSYTDGAAANSDTATFTIPSDYSANAYTFTVSVKEGAGGAEVASDTITIGSIQPGTDGAAGATGDTGATGAAGAAAYTNDILDITFTPAASFTANAATDSWYKDTDATANNYVDKFYSKTEYDGRCFCSFVWDGSPAARMKVGISSSAAAGNPGGESLIEVLYAGGWKGRIVQTGTVRAVFGAVSAGDRLSLRYDGTETTFYQNGVEITPADQPGRFIHTDDASVPSNIGGWMITGSMWSAGASSDQITNVIFLP